MTEMWWILAVAIALGLILALGLGMASKRGDEANERAREDDT